MTKNSYCKEIQNMNIMIGNIIAKAPFQDTIVLREQVQYLKKGNNTKVLLLRPTSKRKMISSSKNTLLEMNVLILTFYQ